MAGIVRRTSDRVAARNFPPSFLDRPRAATVTLLQLKLKHEAHFTRYCMSCFTFSI
jgi:hypothetical protein